MNAALEDRLRRHYDERTSEIPQHGPGLDDGAVVRVRASWSEPKANRTARVSLVIGSIAAATILGFVLVDRPAAQQPDVGAVGSTSQNSSAPPTADAPGRTLPPTVGLNEVPVTIAAGSALTYWRWLPDLDISERGTAQGGTELCWRTPAGTGCVDDSFISPQVGIIPTDGGAILLVRPALVPITPTPTDPLVPKFEQGPPPTIVTAILSDGSTVTVDVRYGEQFGVGYARIALAAGVTVMSATSS